MSSVSSFMFNNILATSISSSSNNCCLPIGPLSLPHCSTVTQLDSLYFLNAWYLSLPTKIFTLLYFFFFSLSCVSLYCPSNNKFRVTTVLQTSSFLKPILLIRFASILVSPISSHLPDGLLFVRICICG